MNGLERGEKLKRRLRNEILKLMTVKNPMKLKEPNKMEPGVVLKFEAST